MFKNFKLSNIYYPLVFLAYFLTLFVPGFRVGLFSSVLMVFMIIMLGLNILKAGSISEYMTLTNVSVAIYFIYNLFSFIWVLKNGYPVSIYIEEFSNSILPMIFFFEAISVSDGDRDRFYRYFLYAFAAFSVVSIIFYLWAPQFYCDFLFNLSLISKADKPTVRVRMESFMGSTTLSFLAVAAMIIASRYVLNYFKASKDGNKSGKIIYTGLLLFAVAVVFLANGRAGMVAAVLVFLFINWLVFFKFDLLSRKYLYIELGIVVLLILAMCIVTPGIAHKIMARLVSLPGAVGQRSEQWISAMNNMHGQWFGNGLGVNGHKALKIQGTHVVADGGLVKLYCEEGALGFSIFAYIMLRLLIKGIKNLDICFAEIMLIIVTLLMSVGSNIIAFQLCTPVFWYMAGMMSACNDSNVIKYDFAKRKKA